VKGDKELSGCRGECHVSVLCPFQTKPPALDRPLRDDLDYDPSDMQLLEVALAHSTVLTYAAFECAAFQ
jgi:hypothetical protein